VDRLLLEPEIRDLLRTVPRIAVVDAVRESLAAARSRRAGPPESWAADVRERLSDRARASLRPVLNATGVVLHTNLGRAPLAPSAVTAMVAVASGYSNLELDLDTGTRGSRSDHCREPLRAATGAEAALAAGRDVLISRGELIEIGGSFRIPDILVRSGARLREIGTTNRTHLDDYRKALDAGIAAVLTVHRSNFEQRGFVATPDPADLAALCREAGVPYLVDVGSGLLADLSAWGLRGEPRVADALAAGADLVIFSGDKLLGGPQAGCIVGRRAAVASCREHPVARAVRADKMTLAGLEATLALYRQPEAAVRAVPVLRMLTLGAEELAQRATRLAASCPPELRPTLEPGESAVGGGSFPGAVLPTTLVALEAGAIGPDGLALRLRLGDPPVVARVGGGRVLLDPRTLPEDSFATVGAALVEALRE
jgi:L-seryl-tRNA(Ser) seleniumtransferase